jgi:Ca2+-binding RTX toxin-like protein
MDGDDAIRGLGAKDHLIGGLGSDVIYGGPGEDFLKGSTWDGRDRATSKDGLYGGPGNDDLEDGAGDGVFYGGDGDDAIYTGRGEEVLYGGDGNDLLISDEDGQRDKLYCGKGKDHYHAGKNDYVDSSCEKKRPLGGGA